MAAALLYSAFRCKFVQLLPQSNCCLKVVSAGYAKKMAAISKVGGKNELEVETDPVKLTKYCCGANIIKDSEEVALKPDSEYPNWLWKLRIKRGPIPLEELDPMTWAYWKRVKRMNLTYDNKLAAKRFKTA